ncbi:MAG: hypothetical protein V2I46_08735 [Bacteroides sp.]|jgi:hypothetical protein|nr:hypothetical protein [Bacteroides sp.]
MKRKSNKIIHQAIKTFGIMALVVFSGLILSSCEKDEELKPVPVISLSTPSAINAAGEEVSTTLSITAPEGIKSLNILKNGVPEPAVAFNGETSLDYEYKYTVENLPIGSVINISFTAIDTKDRPSDIQIFSVTVASKAIVEVPEGNISGTETWTANKIYRLNGFVRVPEGAKLYIEPGTLIIGDRESKGTLIVQMGGQIFAEGTEEHPIVMTSENAPGFREPGDWGGLVICGRAPNNITASTGLPVELEGGYGGFHGGDIPNDNSGVIRYVRIEYAGIPINPNEEVNSLTLGSVGSETTIEYVMASYGLDDAFEWFGGTVNAKYLVANRNLDDDFDVDLGFSGKVQFAVSVRGAALADQSGSNGFEVDNNGSGSAAEPFTSGVFANISMIGPKQDRETPISLQFQHAAQLRRNSRISIYNSYMTGYPNGLYIDDDKAGSGQAALDGHLQIRNLHLAGVNHWGGNGYGSEGTAFEGAPANGAQHPNNPRGVALKSHANFPGGQEAYETWFGTEDFNNHLVSKWEDLGIQASSFELGAPAFTPAGSSPLLNGARWTNTPKADDFFEKVTFVGAFGDTDWTQGWGEWNCHIVEYY